jgi:hypothetical protein
MLDVASNNRVLISNLAGPEAWWQGAGPGEEEDGALLLLEGYFPWCSIRSVLSAIR